MDYSFGNWIKRRRKALDLTQQELAQRVGCSLFAIVKIEADEHRPSRQAGELLAQHLKIRADQKEIFLKVARQEKSIDTLGEQTISARPVVQRTKPIPISPSPLPDYHLPYAGQYRLNGEFFALHKFALVDFMLAIIRTPEYLSR